MKKLLIGLALVAAVTAASAQDHNHGSRGGQATHTATRTTTRTSSHYGGQQRTGGNYSHNSTRTTHSGGSGYSRRTGQTYSSSTYGHHTGSYGRTNGGSFGSGSTYGHRGYASGGYSGHGGSSGSSHYGSRYGMSGSFRHTSIGHPSSWFTGQGGWGRGPAFIHPRFNIYAGYTWNAMPTDAELVWIEDPATGEYYEAYYYPDYGYYAWYDQPLVAVGVYNPSLSFVIRG